MFPIARSAAPSLRSSARLVSARGFSGSAMAFNAHAHDSHGHHEEHGHHDSHGHDHHHGPELAPAENIFNPTVLYLVGVGGLILGAVGFNKSYQANNSEGKTILQSLLGKQNTDAEIQEVNKSYREQVTSTQKLYQLLQFNQPERKFHEFVQERIIPKGSERSHIPGTSLDVEEVGPRRERAKFFKSL